MAPQSDIPQPVANSIVSALFRRDEHQWFSPYAVVSRHFQRAIEARTFRELYLTSARLDELGTIVTKERLAHLQVITLHVALASYDNWQNDDRESQNDAGRTTQVFTSTIQQLFETLSTWSPNDGPSGGIHLELLVESPSDDSAQSPTYNAPSTTRRARQSAAGLDFYSDTLPQINVVSAFTCSGTGRHIQLSTVSLLLDKFSNLRLLDIELEHDTKDERDIEQRRIFVLGLEHYARNVTDLRLCRPHTIPESRRARATSNASRSLFYSVLTSFTLRCTDLTFDDCIDVRDYLASFNDEGHLEQQHPYWPYLERLHIRNSYLMRRPYMRTQSKAQAMQQIGRIMLLVGRAVRYMPVVDDIKIRLYVLAEGRLERINVKYDAWKGGAQVKFSGIRPLAGTVETWKSSVMTARGVELKVT